METYKLIFRGEIAPNKNKESLAKLLCKFLKIPESKSEILFDGKSYALKKGLDNKKSQLVKDKLGAVGIIVHVVREVSIGDELTYQEQVSKENQKPEYEVLINGKRCCKHCKSSLEPDAKPITQSKTSGVQTIPKTSDRATKEQDLAQSWKDKFEIFDKIGTGEKGLFSSMNSAEYKALGFRQRNKVAFNLWAFIFGPLYYLSKGMWFKGIYLFCFQWIYIGFIFFAESMIGHSVPSVFYWLPISVICATFANYDYFRHVRYEEKHWKFMPRFSTSILGTIGVIILSAGLFIGGLTFTPEYLAETKNMMLEDVSGIWRGDSDGAVVKVDFAHKNKLLEINGKKIPVTISSVDQTNSIVTVNVLLNNGQTVQWSIRQLFDEDDNFTLGVTLHDGTQDEMSFVRSL